MTMYESDPDPSNPYDDPNHDQPTRPGKGRRVAFILALVAVLVAVLPWLSSACDPPMTMPLFHRVRELSCRTPRIRQRLRMSPMSSNTLSLDPVGVQAPIVDATVPEGVLTPPENVKNVGIC